MTPSDDEFPGFGGPAEQPMFTPPAKDEATEGVIEATEGDAPEDAGDEPALPALPALLDQSSEPVQQLERMVEELPRYDAELTSIVAYATQLSEPINLDPLAYNNDADYQRALATQAARDVQLTQLYGQHQQLERAKARAQEVLWDQHASNGRAKYADFDRVVGVATFIPSRTMAEAIISSPAGADVAYHLARNPELAKRISALSPVAAAMEIGRLSATMGTAAQASTKRRTSAPPPPPTISGSRGPTKRAVSDMSVDELGKMLYN